MTEKRNLPAIRGSARAELEKYGREEVTPGAAIRQLNATRRSGPSQGVPRHTATGYGPVGTMTQPTAKQIADEVYARMNTEDQIKSDAPIPKKHSRWRTIGVAVAVFALLFSVVMVLFGSDKTSGGNSANTLTVALPGGGSTQVKVLSTATGNVSIPPVAQGCTSYAANFPGNTGNQFGPTQQDFSNANAALQANINLAASDCNFAAYNKLTSEHGLGTVTDAQVANLVSQYAQNPKQWQDDINTFYQTNTQNGRHVILASMPGVRYYSVGQVPGVNGARPTFTLLSQQVDMGQALIFLGADGKPAWQGAIERVACKFQPSIEMPITNLAPAPAPVPQQSTPPVQTTTPCVGCTPVVTCPPGFVVDQFGNCSPPVILCPNGQPPDVNGSCVPPCACCGCTPPPCPPEGCPTTPPTTPSCPPGQNVNPNGVCVVPKPPQEDPNAQGNAPQGGGVNDQPGPGTYTPPSVEQQYQPPATSRTNPAPPPPGASSGSDSAPIVTTTQAPPRESGANQTTVVQSGPTTTTVVVPHTSAVAKPH